ncbi:DUF443 family protein [Erysipelotrichaceae bacterium OttesenSCG-928-M19]|nr:DUF443 family protein [Erysipelotrichaceae bacterium OttesenSCG-928-M19]
MRFRHFKQDDKVYCIDMADFPVATLLRGPVRQNDELYTAYLIKENVDSRMAFESFELGFSVGIIGIGLSRLLSSIKININPLISGFLVAIAFILMCIVVVLVIRKGNRKVNQMNNCSYQKVKVKIKYKGSLVFLNFFYYFILLLFIVAFLTAWKNIETDFFHSLIFLLGIVLIVYLYLYNLPQNRKLNFEIMSE